MEFISNSIKNDSSSMNSSRKKEKLERADTINSGKMVQFVDEQSNVEEGNELVRSLSPSKSKTVIKTPYKIITTQEKIKMAESPKKSPRSPRAANNASKNERVLQIKKFGADTIIASPEKNNFISERVAGVATNQSHVSIKASNNLQTRWPQKILNKKEIENKPWYLLNFEETVELYCGDELRAEKYPKYNKSFVTKIKEAEVQNAVTTPVKSSSSAPSSRRPSFASVKSSSSAKNSVNSKTSSPSTSSLSSKQSKNNNNKSATNPLNTSVLKQQAQEEKLIQSVKMKRLKLSELKKEIVLTNEKIIQIKQFSQKEHEKIQQIIENTELSNENLNYLKLKVTFLLNKTKVSIQELMSKNSENQNYVQQLQYDIKQWEKDNFSHLFNRNNISKIENKIKIEQQRLKLKFKIRIILILFAELMKSHRYNPSFLFQNFQGGNKPTHSHSHSLSTSPVRSSMGAAGAGMILSKSLQKKVSGAAAAAGSGSGRKGSIL